MLEEEEGIYNLELSTNLREVSQCLQNAFFLFEVPIYLCYHTQESITMLCLTDV